MRALCSAHQGVDVTKAEMVEALCDSTYGMMGRATSWSTTPASR
jgi:hypothetical protein